MALMDVFTHFSIIRRERRGIRPEEIKDTRTDFLHKLSTRIVRENQTIVLEDLNGSTESVMQNY
jgi:transposase